MKTDKLSRCCVSNWFSLRSSYVRVNVCLPLLTLVVWSWFPVTYLLSGVVLDAIVCKYLLDVTTFVLCAECTLNHWIRTCRVGLTVLERHHVYPVLYNVSSLHVLLQMIHICELRFDVFFLIIFYYECDLWWFKTKFIIIFLCKYDTNVNIIIRTCNW